MSPLEYNYFLKAKDAKIESGFFFLWFSRLKIFYFKYFRPFERIITMHKDSTGHVGFIFKNGKITSIVKDSSAARNGLLTEHNICEINGQNVIGLKVK